MSVHPILFNYYINKIFIINTIYIWFLSTHLNKFNIFSIFILKINISPIHHMYFQNYTDLLQSKFALAL
jgi:hypothetical protein